MNEEGVYSGTKHQSKKVYNKQASNKSYLYLCAIEMEHAHCFNRGTQMSKIIFSKFCEMNPRNTITAAACVNQYLSAIRAHHGSV